MFINKFLLPMLVMTKQDNIKSEPIHIVTDRNEELTGIIEYKPTTKKRPVVVLVPGFLDSQEEEYLKDLSKLFLNNNFVVVRFDYIHGFGSNSPGPEKATLSRQMEDITRVVEHIIRRSYVDATKIFLVGRCMGGVSSVLMSSFDERIAAVVVINSPMHFEDTFFTRKDPREMSRIRLKQYFHLFHEGLGKEVRINYTFFEDGMKKDMPRAMRNLKQPLLIIYGKKDEVVPETNVESLFEHAIDPKELVLMDSLDHDISGAQIKKVHDAIMVFLNKHFKFN